MMFMFRGASRNAFDAERNSNCLPHNINRISGQKWDPVCLGKRVTATCSENAKRHASRVPTRFIATLLIKIAGRLMQMRLLDKNRLFKRWWLIMIDGTLQDRGRKTKFTRARYRYVLEAKLLGPCGLVIPLITEFQDQRDPLRKKEDCELKAFARLAKRLKRAFPKLPICLLVDGLYPVKLFFDICEQYQWKFIATLREGRQPSAWDEAVQTMSMCPHQVRHHSYMGEHGPVQQTLRWTHQVPFGNYAYQVLFSGEISPVAATLWAWVTNFELEPQNVVAIANQGGRARQAIENNFNVQKNGGFGLEHVFCANENASQTYHIMMQVAHVIQQLCINGILRRLTQACRKISDRKLAELLFDSLRWVPLDQQAPPAIQIRLSSA